MIAVFGATGAIGGAICRWHESRGESVLAIARAATAESGTPLAWSANEPDRGLKDVAEGSVSAVVWAQGANLNDSIHGFDVAAHRRIYDANVTYILLSLDQLLKRNLLVQGARLCIVSSIWQEIGRPKKLSYMVSKAALKGLVQSLAIDLGADGMLVNAVLPGALDTPMTRANLSAAQIATFEGMSPLGQLPALDDVCALVAFLCSPGNTGVTGQFIAADKGFSHAKII